MATSLPGRLDALADAYAEHGYDVRGNLFAGATPEEIAAVESGLGVELPTAYRDLYGWSAGPVDERGPAPVLSFRDMGLLPLSRVLEERDHLVEVYGWFEDVDVRTTAPVAYFEGAVLAVACGPQRLTSAAPHPVVSFFQGIDVHYDSIESMVETALAWVSQPTWRRYEETPDELEIWRRHNVAVDF